MRIRDLPVVGGLVEAGTDDRVFDGLMLAGPLVIVLAVLFGRSVPTVGIALAYLGTFVGYVLYNGLRTE